MRRIAAMFWVSVFLIAVSLAAAIPVSQVTREKMDSTVEISGTVERFTASRSERAPNSFYLKDATGSIRVCIWPDVFSQIASKDALKNGAQVTVSGKVNEFRGNLEVHVRDAASVQIAGAPSASAGATSPSRPAAPASVGAVAPGAGITPAGSVTSAMVDKTITIRGSVKSARKPWNERAPYIIKVADASGSLDVVFWSDVADRLTEGQKVKEGDTVEVTGKVNDFRGTMQLKLEDPANLKTQATDPSLKPAAPAGTEPKVEVPAVPLKDVAAAPSGSLVKISGKVEKVEEIRAGRQLVLSDPTGTATVLLWDTALGLKPEARWLKPSSELTVVARVADHQGQRMLAVTQADELISANP
ncbi:MAG: OB-fold nucleic acid binding domain-containing protein [Candidatus Sumerlaeaceae bacterium]|nr:OB-fold nucleic acid binding domain-containing protein [Candidatus Sumerlaeaceae bacterium]